MEKRLNELCEKLDRIPNVSNYIRSFRYQCIAAYENDILDDQMLEILEGMANLVFEMNVPQFHMEDYIFQTI